MSLRIFILVIFFAFSAIGVAQNPLFGNRNSADTTNNSVKVEKEVEVVSQDDESSNNFSIFSSLIKKNAEIQKQIKDKLAYLSNSYKYKGNNSAIFVIFLLSFLYGVFHSLGPGHGKIFVFSYILTEKPKVLKAVGTSYSIALVHGLSGLIIALIVVFSLNTYSSKAADINETSTIISRISYALIFVIGVWLLIKTLLHKHHHEEKTEKIKFLPFVLSVGSVPCPGTIITVTFLAAMDMLAIGIISSLFIVLGMGITISLIGIISLFSKILVKRIFNSNNENFEKYYNVISISGTILLIVFGLIFFIGTF